MRVRFALVPVGCIASHYIALGIFPPSLVSRMLLLARGTCVRETTKFVE